ncbi:unnamed protein product [Alopecurus aequalis]
MASGAGNSSSSPRSSCSFRNLFLWLLNLSLFALAAAALGLLLLLRPHPTPFGWALVAVHAITLLSALVSLYVLLTRRRRLCCGFPAPAALAVAALCGHALALYAMVLRHDRSLALLGSLRDRREQFVLVFLEEALLLGMLLVQAVALAVACAVRRRWARDHKAAVATADPA